jgi:hypothetical protein
MTYTKKKRGSGLTESIVSGFSSAVFKPKVSGHNIHNFKRDSRIPSNKILYDMENEAYSKLPKMTVDGFVLIANSDTLKFYLKDNIIIVAIRGTADFKDIKSDLMSIYGNVKGSSRYKTDLNDIKEFQQQYPPTEYNYFTVSHSLGGMITDLFLADKSLGIIEGISYNPAVETQFMNNDGNLRIYSSSDEIIYNLMGKYASNTEVRKPKNNSIIKKILKNTVGDPITALKLHLLSTPTLVGGSLLKHYLF